MTDLQLLLVHP